MLSKKFLLLSIFFVVCFIVFFYIFAYNLFYSDEQVLDLNEEEIRRAQNEICGSFDVSLVSCVKKGEFVELTLEGELDGISGLELGFVDPYKDNKTVYVNGHSYPNFFNFVFASTRDFLYSLPVFEDAFLSPPVKVFEIYDDEVINAEEVKVSALVGENFVCQNPVYEINCILDKKTGILGGIFPPDSGGGSGGGGSSGGGASGPSGGGSGGSGPMSGVSQPGSSAGGNPTNQAPIAVFVANPSSGNSPLFVVFNASNSTDPDGNITNYSWDFENNGVFDAFGKVVNKTFNVTTATDFTVLLRVEDNAGGFATASFVVQVGFVTPPPAGNGDCDDGVDNDGDGLTDWEYDLGCYNQHDDTENSGAKMALDNGWTVFEESSDTRIIYVSSSTGNDAWNGFYPEWTNGSNGPKRTLANARVQLRNNMPDWLLLKRGDVWREELPLGANGRSSSERVVIASYGASTVRPLIEDPVNGSGTRVPGFRVTAASRNYFAVVGIHFKGPAFGTTTSNPGMHIVCDDCDSILIEDVKVEHFKDNINLVGKDDPMGMTNVQVRNNVIVDAAGGGTHSQGIYADNVHELLLENNFFDHNGWSADGVTQATIFSHNMYLQKSSPSPTVRNNIALSGASHGLQARNGGTVEDNFFARNGLGFFVSRNSAIARNNIVIEGRDINENTPRAAGMEILQTEDGLIENNIFANKLPTTEGKMYGIQLSISDEVGSINTYDAVIRNNIVYNWRGPSFSVYRPSSVFNSIVVEDNIFQEPFSAEQMVDYLSDPLDLGRFDFNGNTYYTIATANSWFEIGSRLISFTQWKTEADEPDAISQEIEFRDPTRNLASYHASLGRTATYDAFVTEARKQSRFNWREEYTAEEVNEYIREGFEIV